VRRRRNLRRLLWPALNIGKPALNDWPKRWDAMQGCESLHRSQRRTFEKKSVVRNDAPIQGERLTA
jgi:hypothetical protein